MGWLSVFDGLFKCQCCVRESESTVSALANERAYVLPMRVDSLADSDRAYHGRKGIEGQAASEKDAAKREARARRSDRKHERRMVKADARRARRQGGDRAPRVGTREPVLAVGDAAALGSTKC